MAFTGVMRTVALGAAAVVLAACVGSSRTAGDFRHKATNTVKATDSAVATAIMAAQAYLGGKAFGPYAGVVIGDAEKDASSIQAAFDSVQPPDSSSVDVRTRVDDALQGVASALPALRIAARQEDKAKVALALAELEKSRHPLQTLEAL